MTRDKLADAINEEGRDHECPGLCIFWSQLSDSN